MEGESMEVDGSSYIQYGPGWTLTAATSLSPTPSSGKKRDFSEFDLDNVKGRMSLYQSTPKATPHKIITSTPAWRLSLEQRRRASTRLQNPQPVAPNTFRGRIGAIYSSITGVIRQICGLSANTVQGFVTVETDSSSKRRAIELPGGYPGTPPPSSPSAHDSPMETGPSRSEQNHPPNAAKETQTRHLLTTTAATIVQTTVEERYTLMPGAFPESPKEKEPSRPDAAQETQMENPKEKVNKYRTLPRDYNAWHEERRLEREAKAAVEAQQPSSSTTANKFAGKKHLPHKPLTGSPLRLMQRIDQMRAAKKAGDPPKSMAESVLRNERKDAEVDEIVQRVRSLLESPPGRDDFSKSWNERKQREKAEAEEARQQLAREQAAFKEQIAREQEEARKAEQQKVEEAAKKQAEEEAEEAARQKADSIDEKDRLIRDLPPKWAAKVDAAMAVKNRRDVLATNVEGTGLSRHDFGCLLPQKGVDDASGWLNDEIVNAWMSAIVEEKNKEKDYLKDGNRTPLFAAYPSAWYNNVKDKGIKSIERWSRRKKISGTNLLDCERIFFPVNTGAHWMLLTISPKARKMEFLDSLDGPDARSTLFRYSRAWLAMELKDKYVAEEWTQGEAKSAPQGNLNDCGAFVCFNALIAAKGKEYEELAEYRMDDGRKIMAAILLNGGFSGDWML